MLNVASYRVPMSSVSAGQQQIEQATGARDPSTDQMVASHPGSRRRGPEAVHTTSQVCVWAAHEIDL
jgi:hypothetical protein